MQDNDRISHQRLLSIIADQCRPLADTERIALSHSLGRVCRQTIYAPTARPSHANSAVDGFAVNHPGDVRSGQSFEVVDNVAAGHGARVSLKPGQAARIFTGAPIPANTQSVVMQEDCKWAGTALPYAVCVNQSTQLGANIRQSGEDFKQDQVLIDDGDVVGAGHVAALAAFGITDIVVGHLPRVAVFSSGDEICIGSTTRSGNQADANGPMLLSLLVQLGISADFLGVLPDDLQVCKDELWRASSSHNLIVTTGGVSLGEHDHLRATIAELGTVHAWQIAIKPGRPMLFGQINQTYVAALPGNTVATLVCYALYVTEIIARMQAQASHDSSTVAARADFDMPIKKVGRREFLRGRLTYTTEQLPSVVRYQSEGSGLISGLVWANCLIELPESATGVRRGEIVQTRPLTSPVSR